MRGILNERFTTICVLALTLIFVTLLATVGTGKGVAAHAIGPEPSATPAYEGYRGVKIGMTTDEARKLLGTPKEKSNEQDYYVFSDNESAQIMYDSSHTVAAISVTYIGKGSSIPTPKAIFGEDAEVKPNGSIMKLVRYPKNGFWISYNRTSGDDPLVIITAQKMANNPDN